MLRRTYPLLFTVFELGSDTHRLGQGHSSRKKTEYLHYLHQYNTFWTAGPRADIGLPLPPFPSRTHKTMDAESRRVTGCNPYGIKRWCQVLGTDKLVQSSLQLSSRPEGDIHKSSKCAHMILRKVIIAFSSPR